MRNKFNCGLPSFSTHRENKTNSITKYLAQSKSEEKNYCFKSFLFPIRNQDNNLNEIPLLLIKQYDAKSFRPQSIEMRTSYQCLDIKAKSRRKYILNKNTTSARNLNTTKSTQMSEHLSKANKTKTQKQSKFSITNRDSNLPKIDAVKLKKLKLKLHRKTNSLTILINNAIISKK